MGCVLALDRLIHADGQHLVFVPFEPEHTVGMTLVWKKDRIQPKAAEKFLELFSAYVGG